jgi:hypothetical protein
MIRFEILNFLPTMFSQNETVVLNIWDRLIQAEAVLDSYLTNALPWFGEIGEPATLVAVSLGTFVVAKKIRNFIK